MSLFGRNESDMHLELDATIYGDRVTATAT